MRSSAVYCILMVCLLFSCSPRANNQSKSQIVISHQESTKLGNELITFSIRNNSQEALTLLNPQSVNIEFKDGSEWKALRHLACPCGASCARPLEEIELNAQETRNLAWNKKDEWCGEFRVGARPETFSVDAQKGRYRLKITYRSAGVEVHSEYYQFKIK